MQRILNYNISSDNSGQTVIAFLRSHYYPSKFITLLKHTDGSVCVNGVFSKLNTLLKVGDALTINYVEDDESENIVPVPLPFDIVYEDEDIMVVNKPSDMPVHPAINNFENTLANGIAYYFMEKNEHFVFRCINRLDRNTSGLLIVAKHRLSAAILSGYMKNRMIHREYLALVSGIFTEKTGTIDLPIARVDESIIERCVDFEHGLKAVTHYEVISEYIGESSPYGEDCSLLKIHLDTGRTHQIRVHFSHIGHPLLGDSLYNKEPGILKRQALHSHVLEFNHPISFTPLRFVSDIDFTNI
ncbi:MAG: RluA family pseudouridine synthase [Lachnospiraceae bacterium]|nr:RluA family pseudouridine synthase [Lachnospiraceae bacterium]